MSDKARSDAGGEFFTHSERDDGTRDLYSGTSGADEHDHSVISESGNVEYTRDSDTGRFADDSYDADDS